MKIDVVSCIFLNNNGALAMTKKINLLSLLCINTVHLNKTTELNDLNLCLITFENLQIKLKIIVLVVTMQNHRKIDLRIS